MKKNGLIVFLGVLVVLILGVLGYLVWQLQTTNRVSAESLVKGVTIKINNQENLNDFLNRVGFWQRTNWVKTGVPGAVEGKSVKSLNVIHTDVYLFPIMKNESDKNNPSSKWSIKGNEMTLTIEVLGTGDESNLAFQGEFIRVLTPLTVNFENQTTGYRLKYANQPTFFKLTAK